jgi:predicted phage terminase large subunit-like protein
MATAKLKPGDKTREEIESLRRYFANLQGEQADLVKRELATMLPGGDASDLAAARQNFLPFVRRVWPDFIAGRHHDVMAETFERIERGELKRAIINMAPRHTKSEFTSYLLPAWYLGKHPTHKVLEGSHKAELAAGFGRKMRNLIASEPYQEIFPGVQLSKDSRATHRWSTAQGGEFFAVGTSGGAAGKGGDLVIIDDPHSEQDVLKNADMNFTKVWDWYLAGPRQRLQPGAAILVVMTRWGARDLTGMLLQQAVEEELGEQWEVIELPAILPTGNPLWPEYWSIEELERTRATLPISRWQAQYQQTPTSEEGAIIKREWWQDWREPNPPACDFIVQSWDTAFSEKQVSNRSACITWGLFRYKTRGDNPRLVDGIMLLDAWAGRLNFPELKQQAYKLYLQWAPDSLVVEGRATGKPLVQELWRMGIPVSDPTPARGADKITRTNAIADLFSSGTVWAPLGRRWVEEVREEMAAFPHGQYDDLHDAAVQGLFRFRQGGLIRISSDEVEEEALVRQRTPVAYY